VAHPYPPRWLRGIGAGRVKVSDDFWRLYFVVTVDDATIGIQDLIGVNVGSFGTVSTSEAFTDNDGSNGVSRALGYEPNGTTWATRRGNAAPLNVWKLTKPSWEKHRRDDIEVVGVAECLPVLGL
jgi:hypothetical protein